MASFVAETFVSIGVGLGLVFIMFFIINFVTKGFLRSYLRVRSSRGKLILTEVVSQTDNYFTVGSFKEKAFCYSTRNKDKKRITRVPKKAIESVMGVFKIKVDEQDDFFYLSDGKVPAPSELPDATATDHMINRIMMAAGLNDPRVLYILILCVITFVAVLVCIFMVHDATKAAQACQTLTATIR